MSPRTNRKAPVKYKIERDPLPIPRMGGVPAQDWPFMKMKVGDCFYVPCKDEFSIIYFTRQSIHRGTRLVRITGRRFATRYMRDTRRFGVWRIA